MLASSLLVLLGEIIDFTVLRLDLLLEREVVGCTSVYGVEKQHSNHNAHVYWNKHHGQQQQAGVEDGGGAVQLAGCRPAARAEPHLFRQRHGSRIGLRLDGYPEIGRETCQGFPAGGGRLQEFFAEHREAHGPPQRAEWNEAVREIEEAKGGPGDETEKN